MEKEELQEFIKNEMVEWHWDNEMEKMYLILYYHSLKEFTDMLYDDYFAEGGIDSTLNSGGDVVVDMVPICENFGIAAKDVFNKKCWDSDETF